MSKYRGKATVNKLFKLICSWKQNNVNLTGLLAILEKISESLASIAMYDKLAPICKVKKPVDLFPPKAVNLHWSIAITFRQVQKLLL